MKCDYVAIDVNVFEHLLNSKENTNGHITAVLGSLLKDSRLLVDSTGKIMRQYHKRLGSFLRREDDNLHRIIIRRWIEYRKEPPVNTVTNDELMTAITGIIWETMGVDRFYVYIAFKEGRVLITNDRGIYGRREALRNATKRFRPKPLRDADILTSKQTYSKLSRA